MGLYAEYLDKGFDWPALNAERKQQLARVSQIRERPVLVFASALTKDAPIAIDYDDRVPFLDQLSGPKHSNPTRQVGLFVSRPQRIELGLIV